ncbi:FHA domain-containing protein [Telmatocola sphagniphila]|uniref:FHA domain-containing protein n=1 Tax=Telmatocola sphagniphila TaxID=1123043 RepID=A0A8E6EZ73_9BACT|nr:FHA domain-containing protein [Telmatocola sphagniphila]QVL33443.1 FHA domain-containing protein [Telmatocola sphagniphila]
MRIRLVPLNGGNAIDLKKSLLIVGRKEDADIFVAHKSVSKQHCILVQTDGMVFLRDLGSTNGTRVNGQRVRRAALLPNDRISFAGVPYKVVFGEEALDATQSDAIGADEIEALKNMKPDLGEAADPTRDEPTLGPPIVRRDLPDVL